MNQDVGNELDHLCWQRHKVSFLLFVADGLPLEGSNIVSLEKEVMCYQAREGVDMQVTFGQVLSLEEMVDWPPMV